MSPEKGKCLQNNKINALVFIADLILKKCYKKRKYIDNKLNLEPSKVYLRSSLYNKPFLAKLQLIKCVINVTMIKLNTRKCDKKKN